MTKRAFRCFSAFRKKHLWIPCCLVLMLVYRYLFKTHRVTNPSRTNHVPTFRTRPPERKGAYAPPNNRRCYDFNNLHGPEYMKFQCLESKFCNDRISMTSDRRSLNVKNSIDWNQIVFIVMSTGDKNKLDAMASSWIKNLDVNATVFLAIDNSSEYDKYNFLLFENLHVHKYRGSTGLEYLDVKSASVWINVYKKYGKIQEKKFFVKVDDDTFVNSDNLLRFFQEMDNIIDTRNQGIYFGYPFCGDGGQRVQSFTVWCYAAGGAYGMNRKTLGYLIKSLYNGCKYFTEYLRIIQNTTAPLDGISKYNGHFEDVMIARCIRERDSGGDKLGSAMTGCGSFLPFSPLHIYLEKGENGFLDFFSSGKVITIHGLDPDAMRLVNNFFESTLYSNQTSPFTIEHTKTMVKDCHIHLDKMKCVTE